ncbi:hypothetical protein SLA2020_171390 [Shorea laevis]
MEDETWNLGVSRSYQLGLKSQSDLCIDFEDIEDDDELRNEYPCPFCSEDFDRLGLCCHIDEEHPVEAQSGVCPVCATTVGMNMVGHITTQHGSILKSHHKLKLRKGSILPSFKKEFHDEPFQPFPSRSSSTISSSKMAPDPLLSFLFYKAPSDCSKSVPTATSTEVSLEETNSDKKILEKTVHPSPSSDKNLMEKAKKCEFSQGLLLSTIFDNDL